MMSGKNTHTYAHTYVCACVCVYMNIWVYVWQRERLTIDSYNNKCKGIYAKTFSQEKWLSPGVTLYLLEVTGDFSITLGISFGLWS